MRFEHWEVLALFKLKVLTTFFVLFCFPTSLVVSMVLSLLSARIAQGWTCNVFGLFFSVFVFCCFFFFFARLPCNSLLTTRQSQVVSNHIQQGLDQA